MLVFLVIGLRLKAVVGLCVDCMFKRTAGKAMLQSENWGGVSGDGSSIVLSRMDLGIASKLS